MKKYFYLFLGILVSATSFAQVEQKVIIEHFTNTRCGVCANKNRVLYQTLEDYPQVLHIAYHPSLPYPSCTLNQHNPEENDARTKYYDILGSTPRAVIQGEALPIQSPLVKAVDIESRLGMVSDYKVTITNSLVSGRNYRVNFKVERVSGIGNDEISIYVALAEKEIEYNAPNGEDLHHDVFRQMLQNETILLGSVGETESWEMDYTMDTEWVSDEIYAYIIIQDTETKEVLQSESSLSSVSSVYNGRLMASDISIYPNPSSSIINIKSMSTDTFKSIELYSLAGNKIREVKAQITMDISDIPEGIYLVRVISKDDQVVSKKVVIGAK